MIMKYRILELALSMMAAFLLLSAPVKAGPDHDHGNKHKHEHKADHNGEHSHDKAHDHNDDHAHEHSPKRFAETPKVIIDEKGALTASATAINTLVRQALPVEGGLLDESWAQVGNEARTIHKTGKGYFIVLIKNETGEENSLYLLLSDKGELYDANYTGSFEGLKE